MKNILIFTSGYQRWINDTQYDEDFITTFAKLLSKKFNIFVLAPQATNSKKYEIINKIKIYRHKQSIFKNSLAYGSGIIPNIKKNKFLIFDVPFFVFYQLKSLLKIVKKNKIQIIHAHWILPQGLIAVLYKKIFNKKIKILVTCHGSDIFCLDNKILNLLTKFVLKNIDGISVVSTALKEKIKLLGYTKKIYIYPMGVNTNTFNPKKFNINIKKQLNIKKQMLLFVGSCIEIKGLYYLINAMPNIIKKYKDIKLVIIGDGNLKEKMMLLAKNKKIEKNIIFLGYIRHQELPQYFATTDILIVPSLSEGFGLVNIEAMSSGTITVFSNLPTAKDIIIDKETGFLIKPKSSKSISDTIINIINTDSKKINLIKKQARKFVIEHFDWNIVAQKYTKLFTQIISV